MQARWHGPIPAPSQEEASTVVDVCRATRSAPAVAIGAAPRGAVLLLGAARAGAWLGGRAMIYDARRIRSVATITGSATALSHEDR